MIRGVRSLAEQRARQQRGGLVTRARLGGEAMTAPARAGFRARFEREALEQAARHGRRLSPAQLAESADALMRAHMAKMTAARLAKRSQRQADQQFSSDEFPNFQLAEITEIMAAARRKAQRDSRQDRVVIEQIAQPMRLCVGCWVDMCPERPFPAEASSMLCAEHLATYTNQIVSQSSCTIQDMDAPSVAGGESPRATVSSTPRQSKTAKQKTRRAPVLPHERSRNLDHQPVL